jgi:hypothetical protein
MTLNEPNETSLDHRLRARSFSIQSNLEFGREFLKKLEKTPKKFRRMSKTNTRPNRV